MSAKRKISPEERKQKAEERRFKIRINTVFTNVGFAHVATRDEEFEFGGRKGEIDAIYIYNNLVVVSEDTCSKTSNIGDHLNKKALFFQHLKNNKNDFVDFIRTKFLATKNAKLLDGYHSSEVVLSFAYCSRERIETSHVTKHPQINFLHHTELRYFENLVKTIRRSARFEFLKFLRFELHDLQITTLTQEAKKFDCFVLPEPPSGFPNDHKIVAFYADPSSLMELAYVLALPGLAWDFSLSGIEVESSEVEEHVILEALPVAVAA